MTPCCEQVIAGYTALLSAYTESGPREGTALFCPESESRLVYRQGEWMEESRGIDIPGGPVSAEIPESQPPVPGEKCGLCGHRREHCTCREAEEG